MATSPTVARWELSKRLGDRRRELSVDVKTIAKHLGFTRNYWSAVENDKTLIAEDKLRAVFNLLQFNETEQAELLALRENSRIRGWWESFDDVLNEDGRRLVGYEHGAASIRTFESLAIPGLLQTEDYTRAVINQDPQFTLRIDRVVEVRRRRSSLLRQEGGPPFVAIVSEAALIQKWGTDALQASQLNHLLSLANSSSQIQIRVLTFDVPPGMLAAAPTFELLEFESPHLPSVVWQEAFQPVGVVESTAPEFKRVEIAFNDALGRSLSEPASMAYIAELRDRFAST